MVVKPITIQEARDLYFSEKTENLAKMANEVCEKTYGKKVFLRGLIEFSNYCKNNCLYCGIRRDNKKVVRYSLSEGEIFSIVKNGIAAGLKTFVLQSGETPVYSVKRICKLVEGIKNIAPDIAITLSCGYFEKDELFMLKNAGTDRYLLRFEVADENLYSYLKNGESLSKRVAMLYNLKELGFETGSGFMVGLPDETDEIMLKNLKLCKDLDLDMVGIGPFIPHPDTPLKNSRLFPIERTVKAVAILRLLLPYSNIPATTASGTIDPLGREKMLAAGANVLMPNITPENVKEHYLLYPNKICINESGFSCLSCLELRVKSVGKYISYERGDSLNRVNRH
jgi:biotin synthase